MKFIAAVLTSLACASTLAQNAGDDSTHIAGNTSSLVGEPMVKHTVIEDEGSRISELRVRGQTQRITVQPKVGGLRAYEIVINDRSASEAQGSVSGATGKRVWRVLAF